MEHIFLQNESIYLRVPTMEDVDKGYLAGINNQDYDLFTDHAVFPKDKKSLENYMELQRKTQNSLWLGIFLKKTHEYIGNIEIYKINWIHRRGEYSILLWSNHGKGYAYQASQTILDHVFNRMNLNRVELGVSEKHTNAIQLYKKLGFVEEGRQREYFIKDGVPSDTIFMSLLRREFKK
ncbi:MAG: GNAT family N-acetyltransferase [Halobacteriovoraceae bacterium]|nr:GNAT family N-acetyltransferase [Halobacteriovoraceae bacterium]